MRTDTELREAYEYIASTAVRADALHLPRAQRAPAPQRWRGTVGIAVAVAAIVAVVVATVAISRAGQHRNAPPAGGQANYSTQYSFGTASLPGYELKDLSLDPQGQHFDFSPVHAPKSVPVANMVFVDVFTPDAHQRAVLSAYPPVTFGHHSGYYGSLAALSPTGGTGAGLIWQLNSAEWASISGVRDAKSQTPVGRADLVRLAVTLVPKVDDHVALVEVGYLPTYLRFDYAAQYVKQGTMLSPDGTTGTGYRTLSFIDRSVVSDKHSTLDIVSVTDPYVALSDATVANLPSFDNGPWTKTTVRGHLAWVAPHDVLIQWGDVQIGLASTRITGDASTPLLSQAELLKVANSLTVPTSAAIATGYPLASAVPVSAQR